MFYDPLPDRCGSEGALYRPLLQRAGRFDGAVSFLTDACQGRAQIAGFSVAGAHQTGTTPSTAEEGGGSGRRTFAAPIRRSFHRQVLERRPARSSGFRGFCIGRSGNSEEVHRVGPTNPAG